MSEGRKCWLSPQNLYEYDSYTQAEWPALEEGRAFTLPELAARDAKKEQAGYDRAMKEVAEYVDSTLLLQGAFKLNYDRGFAAGVETAIAHCQAGFVWDCAAAASENIERFISRLRALLPAGYKSPADVRREALDEVHKQAHERGHFDLILWIERERRALAEGGK